MKKPARVLQKRTLFRLSGQGPRYLQLYSAVRAAILGGELRPGERLGSTRRLATDLAVSRNVVIAAIEQLAAEGYVVTRRGAGIYVSAELPDLPRPARAVAAVRVPLEEADVRLSAYARRAQAAPTTQVVRAADAPAVPFDFRLGSPALMAFPVDAWAAAVRSAIRASTSSAFDYPPPEGIVALRAQIAQYLRVSRAVRCEPEQVFVVGGTVQGLDLILRALVDPGDQVVCEDPGYPLVRASLIAAGAQVVLAPVDGEGLRVSDLPSAGPRLVYVTPSNQFPTGAVMPLSRRLHLVDWARRADALIVEDDYDSEFRYTSRPLASLQGLDRGGRVIYLGSLSKVLSPGLRLGYLIAPTSLVSTFRRVKALLDAGCSALPQYALAEFVRQGSFERHLRRMRVEYTLRRDALVQALADHLGPRVSVDTSGGGLHLSVHLDLGASAARSLPRAALGKGVGIYPLRWFSPSKQDHRTFLLGFSALTAAQIDEGIRRLARVIKTL